jgi:TolA-binding protein
MSPARPVLVAVILIGSFCTLRPLQAADDPNPEATRQYAVAYGFQSKKLFAQAIPRWAEFIKAFPQDTRIANAQYQLGVCQLSDKKLPEATATFKLILATYPQFKHLDGAQFNLGLTLFQVAQASKQPNDFKAAAAEFANVVTKFAQSTLLADATYYQAECLYLAADKPNAAAAYQKVIATYPNAAILPEVLYGLGTTQADLDQHIEAAATFTKLLQSFPQSPLVPEAKLRLGAALVAQKRHAEAEPYFVQAAAVADFPLADVATLKQGQALFDQNKFPEAAAIFESIPTKFPKSEQLGPAWTGAGKSRFKAAQFPQAQTALTNCVNQKLPSTPEAAYWLGRTLIALKQPANVIAAVDPVIAANPQSEFIPALQLVRIDSIYEIPERRKETIPLYAQFAGQFAANELAPEAKYRAALAALQVGDFPNAQAHAEQFFATAPFAKHPLVPEVVFVGGEAYLLNQPDANLAKAEPLFRRLVTEFAANAHVPQAQVRIGLCLYSAGVATNQPPKFEECIAYLTPIVANLKDPALLAEARYLIGRAHGEMKRHPDAVASFRAAQQAKPDWERLDELLLGLGVSLRAANDPPNAAVELTKLNQIAASKLRDRALFHLGEIDRGLKKPDTALAFYQQVVTAFPMSDLVPASLYGSGAALFEKPDFANAIPHLTKLIAEKPQSELVPAALFLRGLCQHRLKQFDPALKDLTQFVATGKAIEKDSLDAKFASALCQVGLKQFDPAITGLAQLLAAKPDYADADKCYYEIAFANLELKKEKEAADAFRSLATKLPNSPLAAEAWFRVGEFHEAQKQPTESIAAFTAGLAAAKVPELRERLHYKLGWMQHDQKQFPAALTTFTNQIKEFPNGPLAGDANFLAGECQFRQDKFAEALPLYAAVIAAKSERFHAKALYRSGVCTTNLKQWPQAQQHFTALIQAFPKFEQLAEARFGVGFAQQNQTQFDAAKATYLQVTKESRTETAAKARFMMGQCALATKNNAEAAEHFLEAAFGYPYEEWQCQGQFEAAKCFIELKDVEKARESLETVTKRFPNHARAKEATTLLAGLK